MEADKNINSQNNKKINISNRLRECNLQPDQKDI